jgi:hypothetical protein
VLSVIAIHKLLCRDHGTAGFSRARCMDVAGGGT